MFEKIKEVLEKDYIHETPDVLREKEFQKECKKGIKKQASKYGLEIITSSHPYCEFTGFLSNGKNYVYFSIPDYRFWDWEHDVLYRTAKDVKDYKGGANHTCDLKDLCENAYELLARA